MTPPTPAGLGHAIMAYVRDVSRDVHVVQRSGPFLIMFSPGSTSMHHNYALPDDEADPASEEIRAMIGIFVDHGCTPVVEFVPSSAPNLGAALERAGFSVVAHLPLMTVTHDTLKPLDAPSGTRLQVPSSDAALREMVRVQHEAFGEQGGIEAAVEHRRRSLEGGGLLLIARDARDAVIGAAMCRPPRWGLSEVVGVAVAAAHRRRGVAGSLVAELCSRAFAAGADAVYLEAEHGAGGVYARAGFRETASVIHYMFDST